ncbi:MAG: hypothetical protein JWP89_3424 [Schlesneria sp.]|nr:hypothetical protein [Schlesneria sp.]
MTATAPSNTDISSMSRSSEMSETLQRVESLVARAGTLLPAQGPLTGFAFLNPLQAFEDLPFEVGLAKGAELFGCRPYWPKDVYREKLAAGRIALDDVRTVLSAALANSAPTPIAPSGTRFEVRLAMLQYSLHSAPAEELRWFIAETDALTRFSKEVPATIREGFLEATRHWVMQEFVGHTDGHSGDEPMARRPDFQLVTDLLARFGNGPPAGWDQRIWETFSLHLLWLVCREGVKQVELPLPTTSPFRRYRDLLLSATGQDSDLLVHPVLIRFCAAFTDQGVSDWALPDRERGFWNAFRTLYQSAGRRPEPWMHLLAKELSRLVTENTTPSQLILESLEDLGVPEDQWADVVNATVLALRGWAGMIWQMEVRPDRVARPAAPGSLIEFVAVRLLLERCALRYLCQKSAVPMEASLAGSRSVLLERANARSFSSVERRVFYVFQLAQVMGWTPPALSQLTKHGWETLIAEIEDFPSPERRRIFQLAYEHRLLIRTLDAISIKNRCSAKVAAVPRLQFVFCLDTREESFRRHLEEQSPDIETFGTAGFFGVPMYFRGVAEAHFSSQSPVVIRPKHWVVEETSEQVQVHEFRTRSRRVLGLAAHQVHLDSRSFASGAVLSAGLGTLASIPLVMRVLFPQFTAKLRRTLSGFVAPSMATRLRLERKLPTAGPNFGETGFTTEEMAGISEVLLRDIGLTSKFSRLVFFIGHGSTCQNNPHKSTYDCGACTGNPGGPNGRALAAMLNSSEVRGLLANRGLSVPDDTFFIGGLHNTCDDTVSFYDLDQLPKSHADDFAAARRAMEMACQHNAHERCRRFYSASLNITPEQAHQHVKDRSEDLAQTRPEFGNASNAMCIVGRRSRSLSLYLDRRSFLQSYDPKHDDFEYTILERILSAVIPVCSGISMQYYLSAIDSLGWGCGTKLPHNVTSLLGVMDGASSDLRCGLPIQSTEIHEPVRCLFIIETTPEGMHKIMQRNPVIGRILGNGWAQLAVLDPDSDQIQVYQNGEFHVYQASTVELPKATSSADWYCGSRDHLPFALIEE